MHRATHCAVSTASAAHLSTALQQLFRLCCLLVLLSSTTAQAETLPNWAFEPVQIGTQTIVFSGIGDSYDSAQLNALAALMTQLSSQVRTEQHLSLSKHAGHSQQSFTEHTSLHTLELDISGLSVRQRYAGAHQYAVELSVTRPSLVQALQDRIRAQAQQDINALPTHKDQVLWALQNKGPIAKAQRYERALAALGHTTDSQRQQLSQQSSFAQRALQNAGIRITYPHDLQYLAAALSAQFPSSAQDIFLLQLKQRTFSGTSANGPLQRIVVNFSLIDAQQPFSPYLQQEISVIGAGKTAELAAQNAQKKLLDHVNQDLSVWFFN